MLGIGSARRTARRGLPGAATARGAGPRPVPRTRSPASSPSRRWSPPHDVITRGGDYLRVWRLDGVPFECADEHVDRRAPRGHVQPAAQPRRRPVRRLGSTGCTGSIDDAMTLPPEPGFARDLARAYDGCFAVSRLMSNELYLTLVYRPSASSVSRALQSPAAQRAARSPRPRPRRSRVMEEKSALVERVLRGFGPTPPRHRRSEAARFSEVAEFLGFLVNGRWRAVPMHSGPLYRTLPTARLSFGADKLEIRNGDERRYAAFVDIHEYADAVEPGVLDALLYEQSEFIETQSFSILPRREAHALARAAARPADRQRRRRRKPDRRDGRRPERARRRPVLHGRVPLQPARLRRRRGRRRPARGAGGRRRRRSLQPADASRSTSSPTPPGSRRCRATGNGARVTPSCRRAPSRRWPAATTSPAASATAIPGAKRSPLLRTPSGQPFYLNLHKSPDGEDSEDKKLPGNTLIIGSTGVGKTTLVMLLLALTRKWQPGAAPGALRPRSRQRDRDCAHSAVATSRSRPASRPGCNPLQREPTPARIQFWEQLVRTCIESPRAAAAARRRTRDRRARSAPSRRCRRTCGASRRYGRTCRRRTRTASTNGSAAGARAARSAGSSTKPTTDSTDLERASAIGFDTTEFLDLPEVRTPIMMYLLDVMGELVNGERLIYVISEFWKALDNDIFSDFAKQKQKTIRKHNGLGIFDTQSPSDVLRHPIGRTMVEQSVTKIFLANPEALREEYVDGFGLSEAEYDIVRSLGARGGRALHGQAGRQQRDLRARPDGPRGLRDRPVGDDRQRRPPRRDPRTRRRRPSGLAAAPARNAVRARKAAPGKEEPHETSDACTRGVAPCSCRTPSPRAVRQGQRGGHPYCFRHNGRDTAGASHPWAKPAPRRRIVTQGLGTWSRHLPGCSNAPSRSAPDHLPAVDLWTQKIARLWVVKKGTAWLQCQYPDLGSKCVDMSARPPANLPYDAIQ